MAKFTGSLVKYPARATFIWFLGLIILGGITLTLPPCYQREKPPIALIDGLFTATSAVCVTGLAVRSTGNDFSFFGQGIILLLIQLGGIGIITVTTFFTLRMGGRESLRQKAVLAQTLGSTENDLRWVLRSVLRFTFIAEATGFLLLFVRNVFSPEMDYRTKVWHALFHSISAFCNAGFGLFDDSLVRYQGDWFVNGVIALLIITGGIGFPVVLDIQRNWRKRSWIDMWDALSLHSKLMFLGTILLLTFGMAMILLLEWNHALKDMTWDRKILVAAFQSVVPRTAGYQTISMVGLRDATLFVIVVLMMIGAGPCSTAGGFKVATFMVLMAQSWTKFFGWKRVSLFRRSISWETVEQATATALMFGTVAALALIFLLIVEPACQENFLPAVFEIASALGTVGLSVDFTPTMHETGKLVIMCLMFLGRLGPISVFLALSQGERKDLFEYPKEEILVG